MGYSIEIDERGNIVLHNGSYDNQAWPLGTNRYVENLHSAVGEVSPAQNIYPIEIELYLFETPMGEAETTEPFGETPRLRINPRELVDLLEEGESGKLRDSVKATLKPGGGSNPQVETVFAPELATEDVGTVLESEYEIPEIADIAGETVPAEFHRSPFESREKIT